MKYTVIYESGLKYYISSPYSMESEGYWNQPRKRKDFKYLSEAISFMEKLKNRGKEDVEMKKVSYRTHRFIEREDK